MAAHNRTTGIEGSRFGKLVVLEYAGTISHGKDLIKLQTAWLCQCDCGNQKIASTKYLRSLKSKCEKSCGCVARSISAANGKALKGVKRSEPGKANFRSALKNYKNNAKKRGYSFQLTDDQFKMLVRQDCYYCAEPIEKIYKDDQLLDIKWNGVDRMDNTVGYELFNCVPCCKICNRMKLDLTYDQFLLKISKIIKHLKP